MSSEGNIHSFTIPIQEDKISALKITFMKYPEASNSAHQSLGVCSEGLDHGNVSPQGTCFYLVSADMLLEQRSKGESGR